MVRAPGCDGGGETTVLAHIRRAGLGGMGMKVPDLCGCWACHPCHDYIDGRRAIPELAWSKDTIILEALLRTLAALNAEEGLLHVARNK